jgi:hypothetical protein
MKTLLVLLLAVLAVCFAYAEDAPGSLKARWPVKTSLPTSAKLKKKAQHKLDKLINLEAPPAYVRKDTRDSRIPGTVGGDLADGKMVQVDGYVHMLARDPDGDYHIQITESADSLSPCFIVEMPKPENAFVPDASLHPALETERAWVRRELLHDENKQPGTGGHNMNTAPKVRVVGQLFYDDQHVGAGRKGKLGCKQLPSWEVHPVTSIAFLEPKKNKHK